MAKNGTVAYVAVIPSCNVHGGHPAVYDARVRLGGGSGWAFVCQAAFDQGGGQLGTGRGQRLEINPTHTDKETP